MPDDVTRITLAARLEPGVQLNDTYEIDERIASGGMGEVYRGHNIETGEPVAIKTILSELADQGAILALFRREATILSRLHHDAIVRYYSFSRDPRLDRRYLAMEFVNGISLANRIAAAPLTSGQVCRLFAGVAEGLALAHDSGVIHRDLSPDNIILREGDIGRPKLIDFGIARSDNFGEGTLIGSSFAGKYNFISPEQLGIRNREVDGRSDIYSLGLVIAACLRGSPLDMGGTHAEVIAKRSMVPNLSGINGSLQPLLEAMLQPDPDNRPINAMMVADWLRISKTQTGHLGFIHADVGTSPVGDSNEPNNDALADEIDRELNSVLINATEHRVAPEEQQKDGQPASTEVFALIPSSSTPTRQSDVGVISLPIFARTPPSIRPGIEVRQEAAGHSPNTMWYGAGVALLILITGGGLSYLATSGLRNANQSETVFLPSKAVRPAKKPEVHASPSTRAQTAAAPKPAAGVPNPTAPTSYVETARETETGQPTPHCPLAKDGVCGQVNPTGQSPDRYTRIASFIKSYSGGSCFVAVPTVSAGKTGVFQMFARNKARQGNFRRALLAIDETEIETSSSDVTAPQCQSLSFVRSTKRYPAFSLLINLHQTEIANGAKLSGSVLNVAGRELHLLLVDDKGRVQSIDQYLSASDGTNRTFDMPLFLTGNSAAPNQILMAITINPPIPDLNAINEPARTFFSRLDQQIASLDADVDLAVESFELLPNLENNPAARVPVDNFVVQDGWDALGYDLPNMPIGNLTFQQCQTQCQGNNRCLAVTYNKKHSACFMKGDASILIQDDQAISAAREVIVNNIEYSSLSFSKNTALSGDRYTSKQTGYADCVMACAADSRCAGFNFDGNKLCTLLDRVASSSSFAGAASGVKASN